MQTQESNDVDHFQRSSFGNMVTWARSQSLMRIANHGHFVDTLIHNEPVDTDAYHSLIDTITDMDHDYVQVDSKNRRAVHAA